MVKYALAAAMATALLTGCSPELEPPATHLASGPIDSTDSQWVDAKSRNWRTDLPLRPNVSPLSTSGGIAPGMEITQLSPDRATTWHCSAGAEATDAQGPVMISTGHCDANAGAPVTTPDGQPVGTYADSWIGDPKIHFSNEVSVLRLTPGAKPTGPAMLGGWPVDGVLQADTVDALPSGTSVCMQGFPLRGAVCGKLDMALPSRLGVRIGTPVVGGNSGGPAWIVDAASERAVYVGVILSSANDDHGSSVIIANAEPYMREHNLEITRG